MLNLLIFLERIHVGHSCILCMKFILSSSLLVFLDLFESTAKAVAPLLYLRGVRFNVSNQELLQNPDFSTVMKCCSSTTLQVFFVVQYCFFPLTHNIGLYYVARQKGVG